jgi:hypothetical protein
MTISPGVKRQLWISFWVVLVWVVTTLIVLKDEIQQAVMGAGQEDVASSSEKLDELSWEVLVVTPDLRGKLWAKFEQSPLEEREKAFKAVVSMLDGITPDQAKHLTEQFLARAGDSPSREHRQSLFEMLERLVKARKKVVVIIAHYATKNLQSDTSVTKKVDIKNMMQRIEIEIQVTPYKYCLEGKEEEVKRCTHELVRGEHKDYLGHIKEFLKNEESLSKKSEVLVQLAKLKNNYGKEKIPELMKSNNPLEVKLGLKLIREYGLTEYSGALKGMNDSKYESVREDIQSTFNYLLIDRRAPADE